MNTQDYIIISSMAVGWIAGLVAVLTFLALRGRRDLWLRYLNYTWPAGFLTMAAAHWLAWYGLLIAFPAFGLTFLVVWLDSKKRFPR